MSARSGRGPVGQVRRERGPVEQVTGVEERRQQHDAEPREPAEDVADGRELGGAGEDDDAHRARPRSAENPAARAASP